MTVRIFVEPPKDFWFVMGQYISPPSGILALAAYLDEACIHNPLTKRTYLYIAKQAILTEPKSLFLR